MRNHLESDKVEDSKPNYQVQNEFEGAIGQKVLQRGTHPQTGPEQNADDQDCRGPQKYPPCRPNAAGSPKEEEADELEQSTDNEIPFEDSLLG